MRTIFVGPSLFYSQIELTGLDVRPPAAQGDLYVAVQQGATAIGLIDGVFGDAGSVWHKELLYAVSRGVRVFGAASMGALRAAECAAFGVMPVGKIAHDYAQGILDDDADVALTHAPQEFGWQPFTVPLVDVRSTAAACVKAGLLNEVAANAAVEVAASLHFTLRTEEDMIERIEAELGSTLAEVFKAHFVSQKQADAEELVSILRNALDRPDEPHWTFNASPMWKTFVATHA